MNYLYRFLIGVLEGAFIGALVALIVIAIQTPCTCNKAKELNDLTIGEEYE